MPTSPISAGSTRETSQIIAGQAAQQPEAIAIMAAEREPLTYARLAGLLQETGEQLRNLGLGHGDRIAIVLPNGPEAATCFLCVAGVGAAAPLNQAYRRNEFEFYLTDLSARALIVQAGVASPARDAAEAAGVPIIELTPSPMTAGLFTLAAAKGSAPMNNEADYGRDIALVLHTSGTTARPKIVPLTQTNLCESARNIVESLQLTPADRCLNVMPLFHIHGLVGALLSTLHAGGSVICEGPFDAVRSLDILERHRPTWYTAVPTMHQAIVSAATSSERRPTHSLRFIRSCSSALPPSMMGRLEEVFCAPVVEAYGMTEAAHQMTCNPLPPRPRKPGSVGVPTGVAVAIMDQVGQLLPVGAEGEVVIKGPSVTAGYEDNPQANFAAFSSGWFRTGDQGRLDDDGYLHLTGRIKELINRGGEKISPREIDEALLSHPDIAQAMAFAVPHPTLGEDIAAAVVPKDDRTLDPAHVRQHVAAILADFKTPQRVVVVAEIPKGPTGKPQRIGLADKLGVTINLTSDDAGAANDEPSSATERKLAELWGQVLERKNFQRTDGFFASGGDSLSATMLLALVEKHFQRTLPIPALFESRSLAELAAVIERLPPIGGTSLPKFTSLVPFRVEGSRPPFFMVHGHTGRALGLGFITPYLDADQPYYGFIARGMDGRRLPHRSVTQMAADYVSEMCTVQPRGPYYFGGFCAGGMVALEMAQLLMAAGESVGHLVFLDVAHPDNYERPPRWLHAARSVKLHGRRLLMRARLARGSFAPVKLGERIVNETMRRGAMHYRPRRYAGRITLIRSAIHHRSADEHLGWMGAADGGVDLRPVPGDHKWLMTREHIGPAARELQACLNEAFAKSTQRPAIHATRRAA